MSNPQIEKYVKENIGTYSAELIKLQLLKVGYNEIEINEVLAKVKIIESRWKKLKIALVISLLVIVLVIGFFLYLNMNIDNSVNLSEKEIPDENKSLEENKIFPEDCGDGVCDDFEVKNLFCPEDCLSRNNTLQIFNLKYSSVESNAVKLDLYLPKTNCSGKFPLIISIHGGGFESGDKYPVEKPISPDILSDNCYALASINYRLGGEAAFPAGNEDVKSAVRWLRAGAGKYNLDSDNFGVIGGSAGGYYSSFLGTTGDIQGFDVGDNLEYSSAVQAVVDEFGPVNISSLVQNRVDAGLPANSAESIFIGCDISSTNCANAINASPINHISKEDPPFLILHGEKDKIVPVKQSQDFYAQLQSFGVPVTFIMIPNAEHGGVEFDSYNEQIIEFFDKYLKE